METKHINHVVLYAKNFYRHTKDVVKDMQSFMQLDGYRYFQINTPEKVVKCMRNDFIKFMNSVEDPEERARLEKDIDGTVRWCDGPEAHIWHYLIVYSGATIPIVGSQIGYPIYDQYHLPQYGVRDIDFRRDDSYEVLMQKAKTFLDTTHEDRFDEYMNQLMDSYDFDTAAKIFNQLGDDITANGLADELWNDYTEFMDENLLEGGNIKGLYKHNNTKHFSITYSTKNYRVDVDVHAILSSADYVVEKPAAQVDNFEPLICKLFEKAVADNKLIEDTIKARKTANSIFGAESIDKFGDMHLEKDHIIESFNSMCRSLIEDTFTRDYLLEHGRCGIETGCFKYTVTIEPDFVKLNIISTGLFSCSIMESDLKNYSCFVHGEKL